MSDDYYEGKSLLTSASTSMLGLSISDVITDRFKSLPVDLIPEVISSLPIKSLVRFTAVSKSWDSIIKDPDFIRTHLIHPLKSDTHLFLVHNVHSDIVREVELKNSCSLYYDNTAAVTEYCKLEFPIEFPNRPFRVVGTCNRFIALFVTNEVSSESVLEYWVLEKYSEKQSWTKLIILSLHGLIPNVARELCFRKSGEVILLLKDGQIVSLDMVSKEVKHLGMSGGDLSSVHSYEKSLVFLGWEDAVSY